MSLSLSDYGMDESLQFQIKCFDKDYYSDMHNAQIIIKLLEIFDTTTTNTIILRRY